MSSRQEDELDLEAMKIADAVKRSDSLRVPSNPKEAEELCKLFTPKPRAQRKDGAA